MTELEQDLYREAMKYYQEVDQEEENSSHTAFYRTSSEGYPVFRATPRQQELIELWGEDE